MSVVIGAAVHDHAEPSFWRKKLSGLTASITVASLVLLTEWFWAPIEVAAAAISAVFESHDRHAEPLKSVLAGTAIVVLNESSFNQRYQGQSPLDRCKLADDLGQVLKLPRIRTVAVDFDLGPTHQTSKYAIECQQLLNVLLDQYGSKLILMAPTARDADTETWIRDREVNCVKFGHAYLIKTNDVVRKYQQLDGDSYALGFLLAIRLREPQVAPNSSSCPSPTPPLPQGKKDALQVERPISIRSTEALYQHGAKLSLENFCGAQPGQPSPCADIHTVVIGGGYTNDDRFWTLVGPQDGVVAHAAIAACPETRPGHIEHFVIDVLVGFFLFGPAFNRLWKRYFDTVTGRRRAARERTLSRGALSLRQRASFIFPCHPQGAYLWFVWMAVFAVLLLVACSTLSLLLLPVPCLVAVFPAGMAVGFFLEAAVVQSLETATHEAMSLQASVSKYEGPSVSAFRPRLRPDVAHKALLYALVVIIWGMALAKLLHVGPWG